MHLECEVSETLSHKARLAGAAEEILIQYPQVHGFLLQGHGLYSLGIESS